MSVRLAVWVCLAGMAVSGAEARTKRTTSAPSPFAAAGHADLPGLPFSVTPRDDDAPSERWMLEPIAADYAPADPNGFRLRMRGTKVKMRMPLDLR